jgi:UDP-GlcNAc:undecaprenyl-phosphate GlcNAc-1-phosphate transferase
MLTFPANAYLLGFAGALMATALSVPGWRRWCRRTGLVDAPGTRKIHAEPTALAGGLAVFTGLAVAILAGAAAVKFSALDARAEQLLGHGLSRRLLPLVAILGGAFGMVLLGWWDDRHELKAGPKFLGQLAIAALVAAAGVRITLFVPSVVFSYAITVLWILTLTNAFNFLDNMNGLCGGLGAIAAGWFAVAAMRQGQYLVALLALLVCGALLGFLPFNFPRATVFLGDAGSHLVGYLMAVLAVLPHFYSTRHPSPVAVLSPLAILAVPLVDLASVVVIRWRLGKPFWIGDNNHLSHQLVRRGCSRTSAVMLLWLAGAVSGAVVLF